MYTQMIINSISIYDTFQGSSTILLTVKPKLRCVVRYLSEVFHGSEGTQRRERNVDLSAFLSGTL